METALSEQQKTESRVESIDLQPNEIDAAKRFADCCYDDTLRMPKRALMQRVVECGVVTEIATGIYAETPKLRQLGF